MAGASKAAHLTREEVLEMQKEHNRAKSRGEVKSLDEWLKGIYGFSIRSFQGKIKTVGLKKMDKHGFYPIDGAEKQPQTSPQSVEKIEDIVEDTQGVNNPSQGNMTRTSLYISKDILKSIKTEALKQDTTFNDITRKLLKKWLFENER